MAALGRSEAEVVESRVGLSVGGVPLVDMGQLVLYGEDRDKVREAFKQKEVSILVSLNLGGAKATAWGCDLSEEYVTINSTYAT
jgi:glutamate N-acetyltransferase/amino-acid N-acetyltransferase